MYGEAYSTSSLGGTEHAKWNAIIVLSSWVMMCQQQLCSMQRASPARERNAICRIIASVGSSLVLKFHKRPGNVVYQDGGVSMMR